MDEARCRDTSGTPPWVSLADIDKVVERGCSLVDGGVLDRKLELLAGMRLLELRRDPRTAEQDGTSDRLTLLHLLEAAVRVGYALAQAESSGNRRAAEIGLATIAGGSKGGRSPKRLATMAAKSDEWRADALPLIEASLTRHETTRVSHLIRDVNAWWDGAHESAPSDSSLRNYISQLLRDGTVRFL